MALSTIHLLGCAGFLARWEWGSGFFFCLCGWIGRDEQKTHEGLRMLGRVVYPQRFFVSSIFYEKDTGKAASGMLQLYRHETEIKERTMNP